MARESRLRRDLPIDIDIDVLTGIALVAGATHTQYLTAYSRALKRTAATVFKRARGDMKTNLGVRSDTLLRKRLLSFRLVRGASLDEGRLWFGLNAIKVKDLQGRIRGRLRPHHDLRDPRTGRFAPSRRRKRTAPTFDPAGKLLTVTTYEGGEVIRSKREGRRTIAVRDPVTRRTKEAEVDIYAPMLDYIEDNAFDDVAAIFYRHFQSDIKGRVKMRLNVDNWKR